MRLYGTPPRFKNFFYILNISVYDKYDRANQYLLMCPQNHAPRMLPGYRGYPNLDIVLGNPFSIELPTIFTDPDGDAIMYFAWAQI